MPFSSDPQGSAPPRAAATGNQTPRANRYLPLRDCLALNVARTNTPRRRIFATVCRTAKHLRRSRRGDGTQRCGV